MAVNASAQDTTTESEALETDNSVTEIFLELVAQSESKNTTAESEETSTETLFEETETKSQEAQTTSESGVTEDLSAVELTTEDSLTTEIATKINPEGTAP